MIHILALKKFIPKHNTKISIEIYMVFRSQYTQWWWTNCGSINITWIFVFNLNNYFPHYRCDKSRTRKKEDRNSGHGSLGRFGKADGPTNDVIVRRGIDTQKIWNLWFGLFSAEQKILSLIFFPHFFVAKNESVDSSKTVLISGFKPVIFRLQTTQHGWTAKVVISYESSRCWWRVTFSHGQ